MPAKGKAARGDSIRAYAEHRKAKGLPGTSVSAVQRAIKRGTITRNRWGKIDRAQADRDWKRNTDPALSHPKARGKVASGGNGENQEGTYHEHRARIAALDAEIRQLDLDERRRRVIPVDLAGDQQFRYFRALRDRLLNVAGRVAPDILGCRDMREIESAINAEIRAALQEIAESETSQG